MFRYLSSLTLVSLFIVVLAPTGCEAEVNEGCFGGPCGPDTAPKDTPEGAGGGGGGGVDCSGVPDVGSFPCDVYAALKAKCHACHTDPPLNGAPFPLLTLEDTHAPYGMRKRYQRMQEVIDSGFMPLNPAPDLTPEETQTLFDWFGSCAPPEAEGNNCECVDPAACP